MAIAGIDPKCYILALFVRDDGVRFLLGDDPYEFKDKQLHFQPNTVANDVVEVQGNDGYLLAGQVRRPGTQSFDGYVCNGTNSKAEVEVKRREFLQFFRRSHFYKVIYVFPNGTAIQRKQGFLVDDPTVQELYQQYPEYHVALNFEDVNYYTYEEDDQGHEIYAKEAIVPLAGGGATGGLIWDEYGVVWEDPWSDLVSVSGSEIQIDNDAGARASIQGLELQGDTYQQTYSGKNLCNINVSFPFTTSNGLTVDSDNDGFIVINGTASSNLNIKVSTDQLSFLQQYDGQQCTLSFESSGTGSVNNIGLKRDAGGDIIVAQPNSNPKTDTLNLTSVSDAKWQIWTVAGSSFTNYRIRPQLELGSTMTSYEPFTGGQPSPSPSFPQDIQTVTGEQTVDVYDKNLYLPIPGAHPDHGIGATYDNATGEITLNGTGNDTWSNTFQWSAITLPPGKYTVSLTNTIPLNVRMRFLYNDNTYVDGSISSGGKTMTVTAANEVNGIRLWFSGTDETDVNGVKFKIQVEAGEAATDFQLHGGYPINLGKNLLDISKFAMGGMSSGQPSASDFRINNANNPIKVLPNTTYTLSVQLGDTVKGYRVGVHTCRKDGSFISDLGWKQLVPGPYTITTDSNTYFIKFVGSLSTTSNNVTTGGTENTTACSTVEEFMRGCRLQFELGSTVTSMSDYFTPIELCKIGDYQDYIYKSGDDWWLHKTLSSVTFNGTESWGQTTNPARYYRANIDGAITVGADAVSPIISDYFQATTPAKIYNGSVNFGISLDTNVSRVRIRNTNCADHTEFETWLSSNNVSVYYPLATPTDTQITDATLIGQLEALGAMRLFIGENNVLVSATDTNLPATLAFDYYSKFTTIGAEWEEGGTKGATIVDVNAIDNTYPVWELMGPAVNPTLSVLTTNTTLTYNGTITASQKLVIDMFNKTATLNGTSVIGNVSGDFVYMAPGTNRIAYTAGNTDAPDSTIYWQEVVG